MTGCVEKHLLSVPLFSIVAADASPQSRTLSSLKSCPVAQIFGSKSFGVFRQWIPSMKLDLLNSMFSMDFNSVFF